MEKLRESLFCDEKRDRERDAAEETAESHGERIRGAKGLLHKKVKSVWCCKSIVDKAMAHQTH